jgi:hypothetical protein
MAYATWSSDAKLGGVALKAAGLIAADTNSTAVNVGKGKYRIVTNMTAIEVASNDEHYTIVLEGSSDGTNFYEIGTLASVGASEITGRAADDTADEVEVIVDNPYDYQVRVTTYVTGTIATGINFTVTAYPAY